MDWGLVVMVEIISLGWISWFGLGWVGISEFELEI